jgi:hypothetical protein
MQFLRLVVVGLFVGIVIFLLNLFGNVIGKQFKLKGVQRFLGDIIAIIFIIFMYVNARFINTEGGWAMLGFIIVFMTGIIGMISGTIASEILRIYKKRKSHETHH